MAPAQGNHAIVRCKDPPANIQVRCNDPKHPFQAPKRWSSAIFAQFFDILPNFLQFFTNYLPGFDPGSQEQESDALPLGQQPWWKASEVTELFIA